MALLRQKYFSNSTSQFEDISTSQTVATPISDVAGTGTDPQKLRIIPFNQPATTQDLLNLASDLLFNDQQISLESGAFNILLTEGIFRGVEDEFAISSQTTTGFTIGNGRIKISDTIADVQLTVSFVTTTDFPDITGVGFYRRSFIEIDITDTLNPIYTVKNNPEQEEFPGVNTQIERTNTSTTIGLYSVLTQEVSGNTEIVSVDRITNYVGFDGVLANYIKTPVTEEESGFYSLHKFVDLHLRDSAGSLLDWQDGQGSVPSLIQGPRYIFDTGPTTDITSIDETQVNGTAYQPIADGEPSNFPFILDTISNNFTNQSSVEVFEIFLGIRDIPTSYGTEGLSLKVQTADEYALGETISILGVTQNASTVTVTLGNSFDLTSFGITPGTDFALVDSGDGKFQVAKVIAINGPLEIELESTSEIGIIKDITTSSTFKIFDASTVVDVSSESTLTNAELITQVVGQPNGNFGPLNEYSNVRFDFPASFTINKDQWYFIMTRGVQEGPVLETLPSLVVDQPDSTTGNERNGYYIVLYQNLIGLYPNGNFLIEDDFGDIQDTYSGRGQFPFFLPTQYRLVARALDEDAYDPLDSNTWPPSNEVWVDVRTGRFAFRPGQQPKNVYATYYASNQINGDIRGINVRHVEDETSGIFTGRDKLDSIERRFTTGTEFGGAVVVNGIRSTDIGSFKGPVVIENGTDIRLVDTANFDFTCTDNNNWAFLNAGYYDKIVDLTIDTAVTRSSILKANEDDILSGVVSAAYTINTKIPEPYVNNNDLQVWSYGEQYDSVEQFSYAAKAFNDDLGIGVAVPGGFDPGFDGGVLSTAAGTGEYLPDSTIANLSNYHLVPSALGTIFHGSFLSEFVGHPDVIAAGTEEVYKARVVIKDLDNELNERQNPTLPGYILSDEIAVKYALPLKSSISNTGITAIPYIESTDYAGKRNVLNTTIYSPPGSTGIDLYAGGSPSIFTAFDSIFVENPANEVGDYLYVLYVFDDPGAGAVDRGFIKRFDTSKNVDYATDLSIMDPDAPGVYPYADGPLVSPTADILLNGTNTTQIERPKLVIGPNNNIYVFYVNEISPSTFEIRYEAYDQNLNIIERDFADANLGGITLKSVTALNRDYDIEYIAVDNQFVLVYNLEPVPATVETRLAFFDDTLSEIREVAFEAEALTQIKIQKLGNRRYGCSFINTAGELQYRMFTPEGDNILNSSSSALTTVGTDVQSYDSIVTANDSIIFVDGNDIASPNYQIKLSIFNLEGDQLVNQIFRTTPDPISNIKITKINNNANAVLYNIGSGASRATRIVEIMNNGHIMTNSQFLFPDSDTDIGDIQFLADHSFALIRSDQTNTRLEANIIDYRIISSVDLTAQAEVISNLGFEPDSVFITNYLGGGIDHTAVVYGDDASSSGRLQLKVFDTSAGGAGVITEVKDVANLSEGPALNPRVEAITNSSVLIVFSDNGATYGGKVRVCRVSGLAGIPVVEYLDDIAGVPAFKLSGAITTAGTSDILTIGGSNRGNYNDIANYDTDKYGIVFTEYNAAGTDGQLVYADLDISVPSISFVHLTGTGAANYDAITNFNSIDVLISGASARLSVGYSDGTSSYEGKVEIIDGAGATIAAPITLEAGSIADHVKVRAFYQNTVATDEYYFAVAYTDSLTAPANKMILDLYTFDNNLNTVTQVPGVQVELTDEVGAFADIQVKEASGVNVILSVIYSDEQASLAGPASLEYREVSYNSTIAAAPVSASIVGSADGLSGEDATSMSLIFDSTQGAAIAVYSDSGFAVSPPTERIIVSAIASTTSVFRNVNTTSYYNQRKIDLYNTIKIAGLRANNVLLPAKDLYVSKTFNIPDLAVPNGFEDYSIDVLWISNANFVAIFHPVDTAAGHKIFWQEFELQNGNVSAVNGAVTLTTFVGTPEGINMRSFLMETTEQILITYYDPDLAVYRYQIRDYAGSLITGPTDITFNGADDLLIGVTKFDNDNLFYTFKSANDVTIVNNNADFSISTSAPGVAGAWWDFFDATGSSGGTWEITGGVLDNGTPVVGESATYDEAFTSGDEFKVFVEATAGTEYEITGGSVIDANGNSVSNVVTLTAGTNVFFYRSSGGNFGFRNTTGTVADTITDLTIIPKDIVQNYIFDPVNNINIYTSEEYAPIPNIQEITERTFANSTAPVTITGASATTLPTSTSFIPALDGSNAVIVSINGVDFYSSTALGDQVLAFAPIPPGANETGEVRLTPEGANVWNTFEATSENGLRALTLNTGGGGVDIDFYFNSAAWQVAFENTTDEVVITDDGSVYKGSIASSNLVVTGSGKVGVAGGYINVTNTPDTISKVVYDSGGNGMLYFHDGTDLRYWQFGVNGGVGATLTLLGYNLLGPTETFGQNLHDKEFKF